MCCFMYQCTIYVHEISSHAHTGKKNSVQAGSGRILYACVMHAHNTNNGIILSLLVQVGGLLA